MTFFRGWQIQELEFTSSDALMEVRQVSRVM
jgi:hypothetical protein